MFTHEIYTESAVAAHLMLKCFKGSSVQSYNIAPDTEMYVVYVVRRYNHERMIRMLHAANMIYEEVITNKFK